MEQNGQFNFVVTEIGNVAEREPNPEWSIENFKDPRYYVLGLALGGESVYEMDKSRYQIHAGDALFFPKSYVRTASSTVGNPWRFITIAFDILPLAQGQEALLAKLPPLTLGTPQTVRDRFELLHAVWTAKETGYLLKCRSLIEDILYELIRLNIQRQYDPALYQRIDDVRQFIYGNYEKPIRMEELAAIAGCSVSHLRKLFRAVTGTSALSYINTIRIQKAQDLLAAGGMSVGEVASRVGFSDIYYFSRYFKQVTGHAPSYDRPGNEKQPTK
jgi:AraC-like DNA-binding protein